MIDMRYHDLPDWTETVRNEPILPEMDMDCDNKKIIASSMVSCEAFYVEHRTTVTEELLHPAYMYPSCNQISYSTDLCYISPWTLYRYRVLDLTTPQKISLTSLLRICNGIVSLVEYVGATY